MLSCELESEVKKYTVYYGIKMPNLYIKLPSQKFMFLVKSCLLGYYENVMFCNNKI